MAVRKRERIIALFFAVLFLGTSSALAIAVVVSNIQSKNKTDGATSQQASTTNTKGSTTVLQGTQLSGFTPVDQVTELQKIDTVPGTGVEAKSSDTVTVDYTGAIASTGKIFQSSKDSGQPVTFGLNQVIKGWTEGVPGMKVGGTRRLVIPAALAYGASSPSADIPANSNLVFDITLHSIGK